MLFFFVLFFVINFLVFFVINFLSLISFTASANKKKIKSELGQKKNESDTNFRTSQQLYSHTQKILIFHSLPYGD